MNKSLRNICLLYLLVVVTTATTMQTLAQSSDPSANGGLRGPQDIINSTNARDSYGNLRSPDGSASPNYQNPVSNGAEPGSIRPFTDSASGYQAPTQGYQVDPNAYQNSATAPATGTYQPQAASGVPPSYQYSSKHHHHHKQPPIDPNGSQIGAPIGSQTGPLRSGPPDPSYVPPRQGNSSVAGAVIGVPDKAAKTTIGVTGKAAKEVLKALF